jgi:hypothetical protein
MNGIWFSRVAKPMPSNHTQVAGSLKGNYVATLLKGTLKVCWPLVFNSNLVTSLVPSLVPSLAPSLVPSLVCTPTYITSTRASRVGWPSTKDWIDGHWGASPQLLVIIDCMCVCLL